MFDNQRFITRGVDSEIPLETQLLILLMIEQLRAKNIELDYLQVFTLKSVIKNGMTLQSIEHSQEVPPYRIEELYKVKKAVNQKIFVIDDQTHTTILLAEEY